MFSPDFTSKETQPPASSRGPFQASFYCSWHIFSLWLNRYGSKIFIFHTCHQLMMEGTFTKTFWTPYPEQQFCLLVLWYILVGNLVYLEQGSNSWTSFQRMNLHWTFHQPHVWTLSVRKKQYVMSGWSHTKKMSGVTTGRRILYILKLITRWGCATVNKIQSTDPHFKKMIWPKSSETTQLLFTYKTASSLFCQVSMAE